MNISTCSSSASSVGRDDGRDGGKGSQSASDAASAAGPFDLLLNGQENIPAVAVEAPQVPAGVNKDVPDPVSDDALRVGASELAAAYLMAFQPPQLPLAMPPAEVELGSAIQPVESLVTGLLVPGAVTQGTAALGTVAQVAPVQSSLAPALPEEPQSLEQRAPAPSPSSPTSQEDGVQSIFSLPNDVAFAPADMVAPTTLTSAQIQPEVVSAKIARVAPRVGRMMRQIAVDQAQAALPQAVGASARLRGMSAAMQHLSMSDASPQQTKSAVISVDAPKPLQAVSVTNGDAAVKPAAEPTNGQGLASNSEEHSSSDGKVSADNLAGVAGAADSMTSTASTPDFATKLQKPEQMAPVFHQVTEMAERMRSDGMTNVELQVRLHDGQELTIQLHLRDGAFQPVFKTQSVDLRAALEQSWSQFTSCASERGLRVTAPIFEGGQSGMGDFNDSQGRGQQSDPETWKPSESVIPPLAKAGIPSRRAHEHPLDPARTGGLAVYA